MSILNIKPATSPETKKGKSTPRNARHRRQVLTKANRKRLFAQVRMTGGGSLRAVSEMMAQLKDENGNLLPGAVNPETNKPWATSVLLHDERDLVAEILERSIKDYETYKAVQFERWELQLKNAMYMPGIDAKDRISLAMRALSGQDALWGANRGGKYDEKDIMAFLDRITDILTAISEKKENEITVTLPLKDIKEVFRLASAGQRQPTAKLLNAVNGNGHTTMAELK